MRKRKAWEGRWQAQGLTARKEQEQDQQLKHTASDNPATLPPSRNLTDPTQAGGCLWGFVVVIVRSVETAQDYWQSHFLRLLQGVKRSMGSPRFWPSFVTPRMSAEGQWVSLWKARKGNTCCSPGLVSMKIIMHFLWFGGRVTRVSLRDGISMWLIKWVGRDENINWFEQTCVERTHTM